MYALVFGPLGPFVLADVFFCPIMQVHLAEQVALMLCIWVFFAAIGLLMIGFQEILDCAGFFLNRIGMIQDAEKIVQSNMTAHERLDYEYHIRYRAAA